MRARMTVLGALVTAGLVGCSLLFPFDDYGPGTRPVDDAGTSDVTADVAPPPCGLRWPARPVADDPSDEQLDLTLAIDSLSFGVGDGGVQPPTPGFDLDGVCTCPGPGSCARSGSAQACDEDGGVDNAMTNFLRVIAGFGSRVDEGQLNAFLRKGQYVGALLVVKNYNGKPNDAHVQVSTFRSDGTPFIDDAGTNAVPRFDGTDQWTLSRSSLVGGSGPPFVPIAIDLDAYVANGVIVARVDIPLVLPSGASQVPIQTRDGVLVAPLFRDGALWRVKGGVGNGRLSTKAVLTSLGSVQDPFWQGHALCGPSATYKAIKPQLCDAVDIRDREADDNANLPCNGISAGATFSAVTALMGPIGPGLPDSGIVGCGPDYTDDCP